jgi:hypothetical protein
MPANLEKLRHEARAGFELGRLRFGLRALYFVLPLSVLSAAACANPLLAAGAGSIWAAAAIYFLWKGQVFARAAWSGLVWGTAVGMVPVLAELTGKCCALGSHELLCVGIGVLAGSVAVAQASGFRGDRPVFLAVTGTVMALASALGCAVLGLGSVLAVAGGMLLPTVPSLLWLKARPAFSA